jgi:cobalamin biosynthesis Co2+ chelatase CbiK
MKQQGNKTTPKLNNSTVMNISNSEVDKFRQRFQKMIIVRMISETKEDINKCLKEF